jgi:hypothetical protein
MCSPAQNRMASLSTSSVHRIVADATHEDLVANEQDAAATTQAILDVVASVRSRGGPGRVTRSLSTTLGAPPRPLVGGRGLRCRE